MVVAVSAIHALCKGGVTMREQTSKVSQILRKGNSRVSDRYEAPLHSHIAPGSSACGHTSTLAAPGVYYIPTTTATSYDYDERMDSDGA